MAKVNYDPWRTVRFFLEEDGVFEVMFDTLGKSSALRCTCEVFRAGGGCRHTSWAVKNLSTDIREWFLDDFPKEIVNQEAWRKNVLDKYRVEVV